MGIFNEMFGQNDGVKFQYDGHENPYMKMDEYIATNNPEKDVLLGCWVNRKGERPSGVFVIEGLNLNVPDHLITKIDKIRSNPDAVKQIDAGKCGIKYTTYVDKFKKVRNSVEFFDIE